MPFYCRRAHGVGVVLLAALFFVGIVSSGALMAQTSREAAEQAFASGEIQKALEIWMLLAYEGDAVAQARLGTLFDEGTGTVVDPSEAVYWYQRAAEQGEADAQYRLGSAYHQGRGVKTDRKQALYWWEAAAENGHPDAQFDLGRALFYGEDLDQDLVQAERWLSLAAEQGHSGAEAFLKNVSALSEAPTGESRFARVGDQPLFAYATFNRLAPILQRLEPGTLLKIATRRRGWLEVSTPGGFPVWVEAGDLEAFDNGLRIVSGGAPARPEPSNAVTARPVGSLEGGTSVSVLEQKNEWRRVRAPESLTAWVEAIGVTELGARSDDLASEWESDRTGLSETPSRVKVVVDVSSQDEKEVDASTGEVAAPGDEVSVAASVDVPIAQGGSDPADLNDREEKEPEPEAAPLPVASGSLLEVVTDEVTLLSAGTADATVIDTLEPGTRLRVREVDGDFLEVEVAGGFPLWVFGQYVRREGQSGVITGDGVRARPRPETSDDSPPLDSFARDSVVEIVEIKDHPWFLGCQFHPEFKSRPMNPHPLFVSFIKASLENSK